jgi:RNA polymerase sigma factor (TIGR02999 family)
MNRPHDVTQLLREASRRDPGSLERLYAAIYDDLRAVAESRMRQEGADHTLQATALVHEAYLRLVDQTRCRWQDRAHFLAVASQVMRRALVDHARRRDAQKRGGGWERVPFEEALTIGAPDAGRAVLAVDDALHRLAAEHPDKARLVEMRYFGGLTHEECAEVLAVSTKTVSRHLDYAQAWLYRAMTAGGGPE